MSETTQQTYRDLIQDTLRKIWQQYDTVGGIRDIAINEEKEYCNTARGALYAAAHALAKLDNRMPDSRAKMKI